MPKNIRKEVSLINLGLLYPKIWRYPVSVAAIFNLCKLGRRRGRPFCLRLFLEMPCPYLSPCQTAKTCHNLHTQLKFPPSYDSLMPTDSLCWYTERVLCKPYSPSPRLPWPLRPVRMFMERGSGRLYFCSEHFLRIQGKILLGTFSLRRLHVCCGRHFVTLYPQ